MAEALGPSSVVTAWPSAASAGGLADRVGAAVARVAARMPARPAVCTKFIMSSSFVWVCRCRIVGSGCLLHLTVARRVRGFAATACCEAGDPMVSFRRGVQPHALGYASLRWPLRVTRRFVQNRTLSRQGLALMRA